MNDIDYSLTVHQQQSRTEVGKFSRRLNTKVPWQCTLILTWLAKSKLLKSFRFVSEQCDILYYIDKHSVQQNAGIKTCVH